MKVIVKMYKVFERGTKFTLPVHKHVGLICESVVVSLLICSPVEV